MFNRKKNEAPHVLDETIQTLISELGSMTTGEEAHTKAVESLKTLMEIRSAETQAAKKTVNPDVIVAACAHLTGIIMILSYEKLNIVTSKALMLVPKIRT